MEIRALRPSDERLGFSSGDEALDRYFHRFAGQNQFRNYLGVTYIAIEDATVLAFATLAPSEIEIDALPPALQKKLPRYPLPVLRLARLAVSLHAQGQGIGLEMLKYVNVLATQMASDYGCVGVVVDAKPGAVAFYTKYGFVALDVLEGASSERPKLAIMFLSLHAIKRAMNG
jgi:GNAT superfamily N-acetyltransferase